MQILPVAAPAGLPALADLPAALPVVNLYFRPPILPAPAIAYCRLPLLPDQKAVAGCHYCRNTTGKTALCPAMAIIAGHCCSTHIRDRQSKSRQYAKYPATAYIFPYVSGTVRLVRIRLTEGSRAGRDDFRFEQTQSWIRRKSCR